jgi:hypothetical protein
VGCGEVLRRRGGAGQKDLERCEFLVQLLVGGQVVEELGLQIGRVLKVLAQERFARGGVGSAFGLIREEQVAGECEIVREALVGVEIELEVFVCPERVAWMRTGGSREVLLEVCAFEDIDYFAGEGIEVSRPE